MCNTCINYNRLIKVVSSFDQLTTCPAIHVVLQLHRIAKRDNISATGYKRAPCRELWQRAFRRSKAANITTIGQLNIRKSKSTLNERAANFLTTRADGAGRTSTEAGAEQHSYTGNQCTPVNNSGIHKLTSN